MMNGRVMNAWELMGINNVTEDEKLEIMQDKYLMLIAAKFVKYRSENNMTQKILAEKLNISQVMISKIESGAYNISMKSLIEYLFKLGMSLDSIFTEIKEETVTVYQNDVMGVLG